mmetsp:Transcript_63378/g.145814  ORF Transcript_63378/g.145814 Transcript_63378/m.145814 type:complete len:204 (+) Transcript_63378:3952-4563(+)
MAALYADSSSAILSSTSFSCACAAFNFAVLTCKSASAAFNACRLGSTALATKWYLYIARAHIHMASQATEAFLMATGSKSSRSMYGAIFLITDSGMLSLSNSIRSSSNFLGSDSGPVWDAFHQSSIFLAGLSGSAFFGGLMSNMIHTPSMASLTPAGGLASAFTSCTWDNFNFLRHWTATSKAGNASSRSFWASSEIALAAAR